MTRNKQTYQGITIDGGGILGIGSARTLMEFEKDSGRPIFEQFDFIAGTSTGGIIAVLLSLGYSAKEIHQLYIEKGNDIFFIPGWTWKYNPFKPKYSTEKFEKILDELVGDKTMEDLKKPTYITTANIVKNETHVFNRNQNIKLKDVILRTTAAPTFFEPQGEWVDGGIWANDPALVGTLGFKRFTNCDFSQLKILSIGTSGDAPYSNLNTKNMTLAHWIKPLMTFLLQGTEHATEFFMGQLGLNEYERIDPKFKKDWEMDDLEAMYVFEKKWIGEYKKHKDRFKKFFR